MRPLRDRPAPVVRPAALSVVVVLDWVALGLRVAVQLLLATAFGALGLAGPLILLVAVAVALFDFACWRMQMWAIWIRTIFAGLGALVSGVTLLQGVWPAGSILFAQAVFLVLSGLAWAVALAETYRAKSDAARRTLRRSGGARPRRRR